VPVAAAALADGFVGDSLEAVTGGVEQQLLAGAPSLLLAQALSVQLSAPRRRAVCQRVACALELGEA
jgi:hypothetical protein